MKKTKNFFPIFLNKKKFFTFVFVPLLLAGLFVFFVVLGDNPGLAGGGSVQAVSLSKEENNICSVSQNDVKRVEFDCSKTTDQELSKIESSLKLASQSAGDKSGYQIIRGLVLPDGKTKVVYLDKLNPASTRVCVKDQEVASINEVSAGCDGANETLVSCPGSSGQYSCSVEGKYYKVSGASHTAIIELDNSGGINVSSTYRGRVAGRAGAHDYGPSILKIDGTYHMWWCSLPDYAGPWDTIWHATSADGTAWSEPTQILTPESSGLEQSAVCDPSVIKAGDKYFLYYTGIHGVDRGGDQINRIFLATAGSPAGPWTKYRDSSGLPKPILENNNCKKNAEAEYCVGQSTVLYRDNKFYHWYTDTKSGGTMLATSNDGYNYQIQNNGSPVFANTNTYVAFDTASNKYFMIYGDVEDNVLHWNYSGDGVSWQAHDNGRTIATGSQNHESHNSGIAVDPQGNFNKSSFVIYGAGSGWGVWDLERTDFTFNGTITVPPTISSFTASPSTITAGQTSTLSWSVSNATGISISGLGATSGTSRQVTPTVTTTYTLTATNAIGSTTAKATITVGLPPGTVGVFEVCRTDQKLMSVKMFNGTLYAGGYGYFNGQHKGALYNCSNGSFKEFDAESVFGLEEFNGSLYLSQEHGDFSSLDDATVHRLEGNNWVRKFNDPNRVLGMEFKKLGNSLYLSSVAPGGAVFKTTDGSNWSQVFSVNGSTEYLADYNGTIYAGGGADHHTTLYRGGGEKVATPYDNNYNWQIGGMSSFGGNLYLGIGINELNDKCSIAKYNGSSFQTVYTCPSGHKMVTWMGSFGSFVYALVQVEWDAHSGDSHLIRSSDGVNWSNVATFPMPETVWADITPDGNIYVVGGEHGKYGRVYKVGSCTDANCVTPVIISSTCATCNSECKKDPEAWYLNRWDDVKKAGIPAIDHFCADGKEEGRENCFPEDICSQKKCSEDPEAWYLNRWPDVKRDSSFGQVPGGGLKHFCMYGKNEGPRANCFERDACGNIPPENCQADPEAWYLNRWEDVRNSPYGQMTGGGLKHFCENGRDEGPRENCFPAKACGDSAPPTCTNAGPDDWRITETSGVKTVYAYGVKNVRSVYFATWTTANGQDDLIWYPGVDTGGGTWKADINLAKHPGIGEIAVHVYLNPGSVFCDAAGGLRIGLNIPPIVTNCSDNPEVWYLNRWPDVKRDSFFGQVPGGGLKHFCQHGRNEGPRENCFAADACTTTSPTPTPPPPPNQPLTLMSVIGQGTAAQDIIALIYNGRRYWLSPGEYQALGSPAWREVPLAEFTSYPDGTSAITVNGVTIPARNTASYFTTTSTQSSPADTCQANPEAWYLNRWQDVKNSGYGQVANGGLRHFCENGKFEGPRENCFAADACEKAGLGFKDKQTVRVYAFAPGQTGQWWCTNHFNPNLGGTWDCLSVSGGSCSADAQLNSDVTCGRKIGT